MGGGIALTSTFGTLELLSRYRVGRDDRARQRAIEQNLPLVRALARRFARSPEQTEDLVQAGSIGLIKAVDGFDACRGDDLGAYAVPTIVGELRRHQARRSQGTVSLDEELEALAVESDVARSDTRLLLRGALLSLTRRERAVVALRFYRDLTQEDIAAELGLSQAQVSRTLSTALAKLRSTLGEP
ncbi:MAG TPA: sigma-70 family RNA polymerase sigma factor [Gaiella sp.]|nr:sigma-70 family RNA polymerase sigma factor [Gaiella sp.]